VDVSHNLMHLPAVASPVSNDFSTLIPLSKS